ncbi:DUF4244 domain-containing protein [Arthrobacter sp. ISL-85]|uniref:DUF4244 domain-containing protein n=1 Tax=Arthrobacter sp. ISL-85 TaxID=2819115 RepID=UPI002034D0BC
MSINYYRRNYSTGMSSSAASRPIPAAPRRIPGGPTDNPCNTGSTAYTFAPVPLRTTVPAPVRATVPALGRNGTVPRALFPKASFGAPVPRASFPPCSNMVEPNPGAGFTRKTRRGVRLLGSEAGMATAEYAIATLAAVGFAGLLVFILRSDEVRGFLLNLIRTALALP